MSPSPDPSAPRTRPPTLSFAAWFAVAGAVGCALLALGHSGMRVPVLSALGPGGSRAVVPAAIAFAVGTVCYGVLAAGLFGARRWAWWVGLALFVLTIYSATTPWRGVGSAAGLTVAVLGIVALLLPASRRASLGRSAEA